MTESTKIAAELTVKASGAGEVHVSCGLSGCDWNMFATSLEEAKPAASTHICGWHFLETMTLAQLFADYRDGDERGWDTEFEYLEEIHAQKLYELAESVHAEGMREPILLGDDGRVWDGHHRLWAARNIGLKEVPVIHSKDL